MYKALVRFADGENGKRWPADQGGATYSVGDDYPRAGFEPSEEHIEYLLGFGNRFGWPVIERVAEDPDKSGVKEPSRMSKDELIAFAAENKIGLGEAKSKAEILAAIKEALKE